MSKKKKKKKRQNSGGKQAKPTSSGSSSRKPTRSRRPQPTQAQEERPAEALTVGWMICAIATFFGALAALSLWLLLWSTVEGEIAHETRMFLNLMFFTAQISSLVALALTPVIHWLRKSPPPRLITCAVLLIVALPWILRLSLPALP